MTDQLVVRCACGWEVAGNAADVAQAAIEHGRRVHNMEAAPEQVLATAVPADVGDAKPSAVAEP